MQIHPPCPAPFNLAAHVLARAEGLADKSALQILRPSGAERWSYGRLQAAILGCARFLADQGVEPGDRVLLRLGNEAAFPIAFLGAIAMGAVPVPTPAALTEAEITPLSARLAPRAIIAAPGLALPRSASASSPEPRLLGAAQVLAAESLPPAAYQMGDPGRLAYLVFTSGTSGQPMAVAHAHRAVWARKMMHEGWEGLTEADRLLHSGALNWTYTLGTGLLDPWSLGATALIPAEGVEAGQIPLLLRRFDATILASVPGLYRRLLRSPMPTLPRLRHGLSAGEALAPSLRQAWRAATGTDLHEALGMSECSTYLSSSPARPAPMGASGFAQPGRRLCLIEGEIAIHRSDPGLMLGYWDAPEAGAARMRGDWFLTGDLASQDSATGALTYLGRKDDQLNSGGYRLSPLEIEAAFADFAGLGGCAAADLRLDEATSILALFYESTTPLDEGALKQHAMARLAGYKCPRAYVHLPHLPRGANGKLNRRALPLLFPRSP